MRCLGIFARTRRVFVALIDASVVGVRVDADQSGAA